MRPRASRSARRWLVCLAGLALGSVSRAALAQAPLPIRVEREPGAEDCPDTDQLAARVRAMRGDTALAERSSYQVSFRRHSRGFSVTIDSDGSASRNLEASEPSCAALAQATAVTLTVLLDAELAALRAEPPKVVAPRTAPPPPKASPRSRIRPQLSLGAGALVGVLRPLAPALVADAGVELSALRASVGVLWALPRTSELTPGGVRTKLLSASLRVCVGRPWSAEFRLDLCSGALFGSVSAEARGFSVNQRERELFLAFPLELAGSIRSRHVALELGAALLWLTPPNEFVVRGVGAAYQPGALAGLFTLRAVLSR